MLTIRCRLGIAKNGEKGQLQVERNCCTTYEEIDRGRVNLLLMVKLITAEVLEASIQRTGSKKDEH